MGKWLLILFLLTLSLQCDNQCEECENGQCVYCKKGYYNYFNNCIRCPLSCSDCEREGVRGGFRCTSCAAGTTFIEIEGICVANECMEGMCKQCADDYTECLEFIPCYEEYLAREKVFLGLSVTAMVISFISWVVLCGLICKKGC